MTAALVTIGLLVVLVAGWGWHRAGAVTNRPGRGERLVLGRAGTGRPGRGGRPPLGRAVTGRPGRGGRPPPPRASIVGRTAAAIAGSDAAGDPAGRRWEAGRRELLAFLTGGCATCQLFWAGFADLALTGSGAAADIAVVVVTPGPGTESRRVIASRVAAAPEMAVIMSTEAWMDYAVRGAPWFVVVDDGQVVAEGTAGSWSELWELTRA